jgi:signal transduction histidine kinase
VITGAFYLFRIALAWTLVYIASTVTLVKLFVDQHDHDFEPGWLVFAGFLLILYVMVVAFSHLRRVHLIAGRFGADTVSSRQRRQIEIPFESGEAFDMVDAAIRELPGSDQVDSARDSLQVRARVRRLDPYAAESGGMRLARLLGVSRNQILAMVTPNDGAGSLMLICEPARPAWTDWFLVDDGTNLENAEAITRSLTRRVAQRRRNEQADVKEAVTEKELTVAKLNLLHAQVEPHFLYNTLASAQLLTRSDPARADEMLGNLILYLRHSMPRTEDALSTIGAELERARAYLDILTIRMGSRLMPQIQVPANLLSVPFPTMMLQTLVENAIKHGLEPKPGGGTIWLFAAATSGTVSVTVADDGRGFSQDGGGTGIGLRNVRERLNLIYGAGASLSIVSNFPEGVAATITVPALGVEQAQKESAGHV